MDFLNLGSVLLEVAKPKGMWEYLIFGLESLVKNYGLTIILITLAIKLVMLPFDFYNRYINKRNSYKMAEIQPELTKIQAKYGNNKEVLNQKTMEVYKRHNYNIMGSCGGMLINMALTMVIFFTLFSGLNKIASYKIYTEYNTLQQTYTEALGGENSRLITTTAEDGTTTVSIQILDAEGNVLSTNAISAEDDARASQIVVTKYGEIKESFLWIKNIWRPDTNASVVLSYKDFKNNAKKYITEDDYFNDAIYNQVISSIKDSKSYSGNNGYYILIVLAALTTYLSTQVTVWIGKAKAKKNNKPYVDAMSQNKVLVYMMPIIMALFTLFYNAMFAIYIVTGAVFGLLTGPLMTMVVDKVFDKSIKKEQEKTKVSYSRK